jgi:uncharacterized protein
MKVLSPALLAALRQQFLLDWGGIHGVPHWARVRANGLKLATLNGARTDVIELFAFLHDSRRENDGADKEHGLRAAAFAMSLRASLIQIYDEGFDLLVFAITLHSKGLLEAPITVQTCWDADRLDLGRIGRRPDPIRLCTKHARDPAIIEWAYKRSLQKAYRKYTEADTAVLHAIAVSESASREFAEGLASYLKRKLETPGYVFTQEDKDHAKLLIALTTARKE